MVNRDGTEGARGSNRHTTGRRTGRRTKGPPNKQQLLTLCPFKYTNSAPVAGRGRVRAMIGTRRAWIGSGHCTRATRELCRSSSPGTPCLAWGVCVCVGVWVGVPKALVSSVDECSRACSPTLPSHCRSRIEILCCTVIALCMSLPLSVARRAGLRATMERWLYYGDAHDGGDVRMRMRMRWRWKMEDGHHCQILSAHTTWHASQGVGRRKAPQQAPALEEKEMTNPSAK